MLVHSEVLVSLFLHLGDHLIGQELRSFDLFLHPILFINLFRQLRVRTYEFNCPVCLTAIVPKLGNKYSSIREMWRLKVTSSKVASNSCTYFATLDGNAKRAPSGSLGILKSRKLSVNAAASPREYCSPNKSQMYRS